MVNSSGIGECREHFTYDPAAEWVVSTSRILLGPKPNGMNSRSSSVQLVGPDILTKTVGTNPAEMMAVTLVAHRDPETLAWSDEPLQPVPEVTVISDPPPWWRAGKKNAMFYNGMARGDHRGTMMLASALCTDTVEEALEIDSYFHHIQTYLESIPAPEYPFAIDTSLAKEGKRVFTQSCAGCHGTYGETDEEDTYPNLLFSLDIIGTDEAVAIAGTELARIWWIGTSLVLW